MRVHRFLSIVNQRFTATDGIILRVLRDDAESQIVQEPTRLAGAYAAADIGWVQSLSSGVFGSDADYGFRRVPVAVVKYIVVPGLAEIVL